ncbi:hypothetical protein LTR66_012202 [Elasticomyces elasticus]|nr:hypothetical protein LTR66_012202 [Elasticomyces elasticus]
MANVKSLFVSLILAAIFLVQGATAFWRMPCRSRIGLARLDPLMDPGKLSDHVHTIHGGGNFGISSAPQDLVNSTCTSCAVTQDNSGYWTPSLHFMYPNGTTVIVPQIGGMLSYYLLYGENIKAFPAGFQMIAGDKHQRNFSDLPIPDPEKSVWAALGQDSQVDLERKALGFNCLNYNRDPEGSLYRHFMPDKAYLDANCASGLRLELMFPSCWNGKDVDVPDHKSHMAYPDLVMTGYCPKGFETQLPSLFYETIWATNAFTGIDGQFVLSHGDPTGYGYHGDFMMGWDPEFLQSAINQCTNLSGQIQDCPLFNIQTDEEAAKCTIDIPEVLADDNPAGPRDGLAVNVPIQSGPAYATRYAVVGQSAATSFKPDSTAAASSSGTVVPTLTYSAAPSSKSGDQLVTAAEVKGSTAYTQPNSLPTEAAARYNQAYNMPARIANSASATTAAPSLQDAAVPGNIVATSYFTDGNDVVEMVVEEVDVTVTATGSAPTAGANYRRHLHEHRERVHHGVRM